MTAIVGRRLLCAAVAVLLLGVAPVAAQNNQPLAGQSPTLADLAERLLPAVVNISAQIGPSRDRPPAQQPDARRRIPGMPQLPPGSPLEEFFREFFDRERPDQQRRGASMGSGFVIDPTGYIVTNNHVVQDANEIRVSFSDNTTLTARLIGRDRCADLALLKVDAPRPLPHVTFGNSEQTRIGDWVVAIGNPFGLGGTVTQGIISAIARNIPIERLEGGGQGCPSTYIDFMQTDAAINRGNSGGPLFSLRGEVVGINTAIFTPTGANAGIAFAIPSARAERVIQQLREHGRVRRGWLGVRIQTVTDDIAESVGLDRPRGALIAGVVERGPAERARLQRGDVVLRFDGREVADMGRLPIIVGETEVDREVPVVVWRERREVTLPVKVGELPDNVEQQAAVQRNDVRQDRRPDTAVLGMNLAPLTPELRQRYQISERTRGVVVTRVDDNSAAAQRGIREGDVIVEISQQPVGTPAQISQRVEQEREQGRRSVLVTIERQGEQRFLGLQLPPRG
jgi:serine protease Do